MKEIIIAPSVLAANFLNLGSEISKVEESGAEWLHLDVMDGTFVENISFGPEIISTIKKNTKLFCDVHLMVQNPKHLFKTFVDIGSDCITIHYEATKDLRGDLLFLKKLGVKCGVAINPITPVSAIKDILDLVDLVLVMSVVPGFGGQKFKVEALTKIEQLVKLKNSSRNYKISVDGGINLSNIKSLKEKSVDVVVTGSSFFKDKNQKKFIQEMKEI